MDYCMRTLINTCRLGPGPIIAYGSGDRSNAGPTESIVISTWHARRHMPSSPTTPCPKP